MYCWGEERGEEEDGGELARRGEGESGKGEEGEEGVGGKRERTGERGEEAAAAEGVTGGGVGLPGVLARNEGVVLLRAALEGAEVRISRRMASAWS